MTALITTDLDGTVMFSRRAMAVAPQPASAALVPVDHDEGRTYAFMSSVVARAWARLSARRAIVPATTRSVPQYLRLRLPGPPPEVAVVCNGARILVGGEVDSAWERTVRRRMRDAASFDSVWRTAGGWYERHPFAAMRAVDDLFLYLTVRRRSPWLTSVAREVGDWAGGVGWRASLQARKLYLLPASLDKAAAAAHVVASRASDRHVAGGDSLLDAEMLRAADAAIRPAHGELHDTGVPLPGCRVTRRAGLAAGDEIIRWFGRQLRPF